MSTKSQTAPTYASQVPCFPTDWRDRDALTGRILQIIEAGVPEGSQQTAMKNLVKEATKQHFINGFNDQFDRLINTGGLSGCDKDVFYEALWSATLLNRESEAPSIQQSSN